MNVAADKQWHLDKRIPVAFIIALMLQFGGGVWFISQLSASVEANADKITAMERSVIEFREKNNDVKDRVIRIEEKIISLHDLVERVLRLEDRRRN